MHRARKSVRSVLAIAALAVPLSAPTVAAEHIASRAGQVAQVAPLPEPSALTLKATRPRLPEPYAVTLKATRPQLPEPYEVTLKATRPALPEPFALNLRATRPQLAEPYEVTLKATRPALPEPFALNLRATRPQLSEPYEVTLKATRPRLPEPFALTLKATRSAVALVAVPDVLGMNYQAAARRISAAGLSPVPALGRAAAEREQAPGVVYATDPRPNAQAAKGGEVSLVVYGPRPKRTVPNVVGMPPAEARGILAGVGFAPGEPAPGDAAPENAEPGTVAATVPPHPTELEIFSPVGIVLHGPRAPAPPAEPEGRMVPEVSGLAVEAAIGILEQHGFTSGGFALGDPAGEGEVPGTVARTDPPAGSEQPKGAAVALVLFAPRKPAAPPGIGATATIQPPPVATPPATVSPPPNAPAPPVAGIVRPGEVPPAQRTRPPAAPPGPAPVPPEWAGRWIGRWELSSTTPSVRTASGKPWPVKQQIEVFRSGDKVLVGTRGRDGSFARTAEPVFGENRMSFKILSVMNREVSFDLVQGNGVCSGSSRTEKAIMQNKRIVGWGPWIDWKVACRRL